MSDGDITYRVIAAGAANQSRVICTFNPTPLTFLSISAYRNAYRISARIISRTNRRECKKYSEYQFETQYQFDIRFVIT